MHTEGLCVKPLKGHIVNFLSLLLGKLGNRHQRDKKGGGNGKTHASNCSGRMLLGLEAWPVGWCVILNQPP